MKISVTIIAKNASKYLVEVLDCLKAFDEVIFLDNLSDDDTLQIAKSYDNVKIFQTPFIGFGKMKNLAISYAKNDWIFSIDSDEVIERELLDEILNLNLESTTNIYSISRKNLYKDKWIKGCDWYPDYVNRIFNKNHTRFNDNEVHESLILKEDSKIIKLKGMMRHYSYDSISQLIYKMNLYTTLEIKRNPNKKSSPLKAILHAFWTFNRNYFLKKGFMLGYEGFLISYCNASGTLFKYLKIYEENIKKHKR